MHAKILSATTYGVTAQEVLVEVDLALGLLAFNIVGLPDTAIKESRQRIATALKNAGFKIPDRKITVNLAPADIKKEGTLFDLPIAVGILQACQQLRLDPVFLQETLFLGELLLDGSLHRINGALTIAHEARYVLGKKRLVLPLQNAQEAAVIEGIEVIGVGSLQELMQIFQQNHQAYVTASQPFSASVEPHADYAEVHGQSEAKRALQIAAAGHHNLLFIGSPGSGKTMLAERLPSLMRPLSTTEILETSKIYSVSGKLSGKPLITARPFRAPHHTISLAGLIGGGSWPQPGEASLAHHGILFLDELTEFKRTVIEGLRQPLENRKISIARAQQTLEFPASFMLVAALNPCPCGYLADAAKRCVCTQQEIHRYLQKLSGPFLDRIDIQVHVPSVSYQTIKSGKKSQSSQELREGVERAQQLQYTRFGSSDITNATMSAQQIKEFCELSSAADEALQQAFTALKLSMRGYHKILKVARTIADIEGSSQIERAHIVEATTYRSLEQTLERLRR